MSGKLTRIRVTFNAEPTGSVVTVWLWTTDDANLPSYAHTARVFSRPFAEGELDGRQIAIAVVGLAEDIHKAILESLAFLAPTRKKL